LAKRSMSLIHMGNAIVVKRARDTGIMAEVTGMIKI
jgi:hypothetical protein